MKQVVVDSSSDNWPVRFFKMMLKRVVNRVYENARIWFCIMIHKWQLDADCNHELTVPLIPQKTLGYIDSCLCVVFSPNGRSGLEVCIPPQTRYRRIFFNCSTSTRALVLRRTRRNSLSLERVYCGFASFTVESFRLNGAKLARNIGESNPRRLSNESTSIHRYCTNLCIICIAL